MSLAPGEIVLEGASRSFSIRADRGSTLKDVLFSRRPAGPEPVHALRGVSLHVRPGETVGIVGRNGAGKSSTLRVLAGIVPPDEGRVEVGGRVVTLLELGAGFSRDFSGRENIELNGALHGLTRAQVAERMEPIVAFSELGDFVDLPVKTYSAGMFLRLGFAIAAHLDADLLLIDEVLAVGDEAFQRKCLRRISERIALGGTLLLVSHDAGSIERVCERVVVLEGGQVVFDGPTADGLMFYRRLLGTDAASDVPIPRAAELPVGIEELELEDQDGRRCRIFRPGDPLRVRLAVARRRRTAGGEAQLRLEVHDRRGTRVFATDTAVPLGDDPAALAFEVPRLALLGGDYDLLVRAADAGDPDAGHFDRLLGFSVVDDSEAEGFADLRGAWSVAAGARVAG